MPLWYPCWDRHRPVVVNVLALRVLRWRDWARRCGGGVDNSLGDWYYGECDLREIYAIGVLGSKGVKGYVTSDNPKNCGKGNL